MGIFLAQSLVEFNTGLFCPSWGTVCSVYSIATLGFTIDKDKNDQSTMEIHVLAMKLVTDQQSSWFQYLRGTLVIFVLVYSTIEVLA